MTVKNPLAKYNRSNLIFIGVSIAVSLALSALAEVVIFGLLLSHAPRFYLARFLVVAAFLCSLALLIKFRRYFVENLHKAFLLISLVTGISYVIILPCTLYATPDDQIHFVRALALSSESIPASDAFRIVESNDAAKSVSKLNFIEREEAYRIINAANQPDTVQIITLSDDAELYQRLAYLPYHLGFKIGSFLHLSFVTTIMLAKLCNMLCYIALFYFAIKVSQKHLRPIFFATGLIVSCICIASQFSVDPMVTAGLSLALAIFARMLSQPKVDPKLLIAFVFASIWGCLPKAIYCPLILLPLLIPNKQFDHPKRALAMQLSLVLITVLIAATFVLPVLSGSMTPDVRGGNTSVSGQLHFLFANPVRVPVIVGRSITEAVAPVFLSAESFGNMGYISTGHYTTAFVGLIQIIIFFSTIFTIKLDRKIFTTRLKVCLALAFVVVVGAIVASLYLSYSQVGAPHASGVQSRYFLPLLPLFALIFAPRGAKTEPYPYATTLVFISYCCLALTVAIYVAKYSIM